MNVCIISREYPPDSAFGGIARAVHVEAQALARAGADVHVITYSPSGVFKRLIADGVVVHRVAAPPVQGVGAMPYISAGLWSHTVAGYYAALDALVNFDVVQAQDYYGETLHLERRPETALVVRLHALSGVVSELSGRPRSGGDRGLEALEFAALARADLLLGPTQRVIDATRSFMGERMPPVRDLPLALPFDRFFSKPRAHAAGPVRLVFVGRLEPLKRPELALHALAATQGTSLTFVGRDIDGYKDLTLVPLMRELGLDESRVRFLPQLDEAGVIEQLRAADCAILPSRFENFHMAAVEALACGVPVITSDRNGLSGWLSPDDGLLAFPIDDDHAFGHLAAQVMADRGTLACAGQRGSERVRELFDPDRVAAEQLSIYQEVSPAKSAPAAKPADGGPWLGIVVLAYNALEYTKRCLTSVLRHTDTDFTVYLVDNASTDATPEWVAGLDPRVRLLRSEENLGVSGGRNVGITAALDDGVDHIVFLDNDVEVYANWWQPFAWALAANPDVAIAGERGVRLKFHTNGRNEETMHGPGPLEVDMVVGFCMFMSAAAVRQIGLFDENLGLFWHDDDDYCLRAKRLGYRVLHIGSERLIHFEHKSSSEVDGIWVSPDTDSPSSLSTHNQRYLAEKWRADNRIAGGIADARGFAALAFADELIAAPELLKAWGHEFDGRDDATLAIYVDGDERDSAIAGLERAVAAAGLDGETAADLMIFAANPGEEAAITGSIDAVFTRRRPAGVFHAPPHFGDDEIAELRALAERRWVVVQQRAA